jgi:hypothetical protein
MLILTFESLAVSLSSYVFLYSLLPISLKSSLFLKCLSDRIIHFHPSLHSAPLHQITLLPNPSLSLPTREQVTTKSLMKLTSRPPATPSEQVTSRTASSLCGGGPERRYELCHRDPCPGETLQERPGETPSFMDDPWRERQCARHDRKPYRGKYMRWKPYIEGKCRSGQSPHPSSSQSQTIIKYSASNLDIGY